MKSPEVLGRRCLFGLLLESFGSSRLYDVEDLCWKHAVLAKDVFIDNLVFLDVCLTVSDLGDNETVFSKKDGK